MPSPSSALPRGVFTMQAQERIVFGEPAGVALLAEIERLGARRVFVTSTRSLAKLSDGPLQAIEKALGGLHVGSFSAIASHSPREDVIAGAAAARGARADLIVAVGGGSVVDATKAMLMCLWQGIESPDAMEPYRSGRDDGRIPTPMAPPADPVRMIAIPTTLSAAEFTPNAGVTNSATHFKQSFGHRLFVPVTVILDPVMTLATPQWLLVSTGIRSVDHAAESYCSPTANPATEPLSLQGLRLLHRALPAIVERADDLAARLDGQFGMWQAIAASIAGAGSGASHGIGYVLGSGYGVPHGHTSCVMLPAVLRWNASFNGERQKALSTAMGAPDRPAGDLVAELVQRIGQPGNLRALGIKREALADIAERAMTYAPVRRNPKKISGPADVMEILEIAW
jgi:maleylacetate reductase